jgi:hypothetical protein
MVATRFACATSVCIAVAPFALEGFGFRALALGQIQHEGDALVALFVERSRPDQHWHTTAVLTEVLPVTATADSR